MIYHLTPFSVTDLQLYELLMILGLLALALAPAIAIIWFIYTKDEYEREPTGLLAIAFFLGILSIIPALLGGALGESLGYTTSVNIYTTAIYAFIIVALSEELAKFIFLRGYLFGKSDFNEPFDGIVYAVMVGMGFAAFENIIYVVQGGLAVGILRMFTAVPAHAAFGVIMGYYVGMAKFDFKNRNKLLLKGLFWAVIAHGAYDFFLMQERFEILGIMAFVVLIFSIQFSQKAIALHQDASPFHPDRLNENEFLVDKNDDIDESDIPPVIDGAEEIT